MNTRLSTEPSSYQDAGGQHHHSDSVKSVSHSFKSDFDLAAVKAKYGVGDSDGDGVLSRNKREPRRRPGGRRGPSLPRFAGIEHQFLREKIVEELGHPEGKLDRRAPLGFRTSGFTAISLANFKIASTGTAGRVNCDFQNLVVRLVTA